MYQTANIPLTMNPGSTLREKFTWNQGTPQCYKPVDLTGTTMYGSITDMSGNVLVSLTEAAGNLINGHEDGSTTILLSHLITQAWAHEYALYEVFIQMTNNDVVRKYAGTLHCLRA